MDETSLQRNEKTSAARAAMRDVKDDQFWELFDRCSPYSLLTPEKMYNLYQSISYIVDNDIHGDIIECGVWKGGAILLALETLCLRESFDRAVFLYDTFEGFVERTSDDVSNHGKEIGKVKYPNFLEEVKNNISGTQYPSANIRMIPGDVRSTVSRANHDKISILRLDTDTYQSTLHELSELYDSVVTGGVVIIDDYGYSLGCRKAFDEFFSSRPAPLFQRPNSGARAAVKI